MTEYALFSLKFFKCNIRELLQQRVDIQARLNLMSYEGNPEIKEVSGTFLREKCWKNF